MSYSTSDDIVDALFQFVGDLAVAFGWSIVNEQAETDRPTTPAELRASWAEASAWARQIIAQHATD